MKNFRTLWWKKFRQGCKNCILHVQRNILGFKKISNVNVFTPIGQRTEKKVYIVVEWLSFLNKLRRKIIKYFILRNKQGIEKGSLLIFLERLVKNKLYRMLYMIRIASYRKLPLLSFYLSFQYWEWKKFLLGLLETKPMAEKTFFSAETVPCLVRAHSE